MAARGGRDVRLEQVRVEYARWLLTDRITRESNGLPVTNRDFAQAKDVNERTLRRWRTDDPRFDELFASEQARAAAALPGGAIHRGPSLDRPADEAEAVEDARAQGVTDPERLTYLSVKAAIVEKAKASDRESLAQYMKHWGHEFVEEEREQRSQGFAHLSDGDLVDEIRGLLGVLGQTDG